MAARNAPTPSDERNICMMRTVSSTKPAFCRPQPRRTTKNFVRQCFFCRTSLNRNEIMKRKNIPAELYGSIFRKICVIINSEHALIEKSIETLSVEVVNAVIHVCETCRGLMLHVHRLLEDSKTKERTIIEEEVRITKNMLTFKILQAEKKVNLFPLPEGLVDPHKVHMHWETKLREIECVTNLESTGVHQVVLENQQLTPFGNVQELPLSLQQGYLTLNVLGYDYLMEETIDESDDDDEVQFIEEKIKSKSVEILGIDDEAYAKLKAAATSTLFEPSPSVFLSSNIAGRTSTEMVSNYRGNPECIQLGLMGANQPPLSQSQVPLFPKPMSVSGLPGNVQGNLNDSGFQTNTRGSPASPLKGFPGKQQKSSYSNSIGTVTVAPSTSKPMDLQFATHIGSTTVLPQVELQDADGNVDEFETVNVVGYDQTLEKYNECGVAVADEATVSDPQSPTEETAGYNRYSDSQMDIQLQIRNSTDVKPNGPALFTCNVCSKPFNTKNALNGHAWMHRRPYCALCRTFLPSSDAYAEHMTQLHDATRPSNCFVCGKGFENNDKLIVHLRSHKEGNTYSCSAPECKETFQTKLECIKHLKLCPFIPPLVNLLGKRKRAPRNKLAQPQRMTLPVLDTPPPSDTQSDCGSASGSGSGMGLDLAMYTGFTVDVVKPEAECLENSSEFDYHDDENKFPMYAAEQEEGEEYEEQYEYGDGGGEDEEQEFEFEDIEIINSTDPLANV